MKWKNISMVLCVFLFPNFISVRLLNLMGHKVSPESYIGFSLILCDRLYMDAGARIGHLNIIIIRKLLMRSSAYIKSRNRIRGPIHIMLSSRAGISNNNSIFRAGVPISYGASYLKIGEMANITSKHHLDCTRSISIGAYSTIGGFGSQFWTHGYFHGTVGVERVRIDGEIILGNNVYVGSRCTFNPAVEVANGVCIGGHVCISKSLRKTGMYVAQPLRFLPRNIDQIRASLNKVKRTPLIDEVYEKAIG